MEKCPVGATDVQSAGEESEGSLGKALTQGLVILEEREGDLGRNWHV